jgi:hypothetical protein
MVVEKQLGWMCMVLARNNQANQVLITSYSPYLCCPHKLSQARLAQALHEPGPSRRRRRRCILPRRELRRATQCILPSAEHSGEQDAF